MAHYYKSIRDYIQILEANDKLFRIKREVNKDTEIMPLAKWEYRGLSDKERKAFLFENVTDVKGRKYHGSVLVAAHGASREVYAMAMMCQAEEVRSKWEEAQRHPIPPRIVERGPIQEEIHVGEKLLEHGGLDEFPIPLFTPGFDNAPYITGGCWFCKDPDTGNVNVAIYRGMVKSPTRVGCNARLPQHLGVNWEKYRAKGVPMPVALVVGATPNIGLLSVAKLPYDAGEIAVAGGFAGEPVELVKCQTVDLEVPATAEIVLEGEVPIDILEREAPFGEYTGYMGMGVPNLVFNITCITHRKNPVWSAFQGGFPPSESSVTISIHAEAALYHFLKNDLGITDVMDVGLRHEIYPLVVISMRRGSGHVQVWKALNGANAYDIRYGKIIVAVDDDIDPRDADSVIWALCYGMQPDSDIQICGRNKISLMDPSTAPMEQHTERTHQLTSSMMIDATRKWDYPPVSLPKKEFMERARQIWEEEGLPPLKPRDPWYGYSLGEWPKEAAEEADLALKGEHYKTGEKLAQQRIRIK